jgi:hypothetical protein
MRRTTYSDGRIAGNRGAVLAGEGFAGENPNLAYRALTETESEQAIVVYSAAK